MVKSYLLAQLELEAFFSMSGLPVFIALSYIGFIGFC